MYLGVCTWPYNDFIFYKIVGKPELIYVKNGTRSYTHNTISKISPVSGDSQRKLNGGAGLEVGFEKTLASSKGSLRCREGCHGSAVCLPKAELYCSMQTRGREQERQLTHFMIFFLNKLMQVLVSDGCKIYGTSPGPASLALTASVGFCCMTMHPVSVFSGI